MDEEEAVALVVNGFCKEVLQALPMEFAMEAQSLVAISLKDRLGDTAKPAPCCLAFGPAWP